MKKKISEELFVSNILETIDNQTKYKTKKLIVLNVEVLNYIHILYMVHILLQI